MPFPDTTPATAVAATSLAGNNATTAGLPNSNGFDRLTYLEAIVANLMTSQPSTLSSQSIATVGGALSVYRAVFSKTGLADTVATNVVTVTVPNIKVGAIVRTTFIGSLGAGGAIGAGEATHGISYDFSIVRTAGVAAVALIATATGSTKQAVAGATTVTTAGAVSAVTGAVGASNSFQLTCAITKGGGASDNHTCMVIVEVFNEFAGGVTVSQS